ncbi:hypothetical protein ACA348_03625 [Orientia tsutsugamushi]|uniref:hypothetical protein n=1 Tax=Orientia tsutsugamushi TaxID=784 RepID=UPI0035296AE7
MTYEKQDSLYTFNQYLDNKDALETKLLEGHPWSKKFLSKIFHGNQESAYSNENFDKFISKLDLDNLEKLLQPARIIQASNITCMICYSNRTINLNVLADTLTVLTSNIEILKYLYTLDIPFSAISTKLFRIGEVNAQKILKWILGVSELTLENLSGNTYEEICEKRADVLNFLKTARSEYYAINSANDDVDNNITNQTMIKQNPFDLYITNNNKLENHSWSMKLFLSKILQKNQRSNYSNKDFDGFISKLDLDNLEKLLRPARIIEAASITSMICYSNRTINLDVLADTLTVLTSNIEILKYLYTLDIPFSAISGKLGHIEFSAKDCLEKLFKILEIKRESQKNVKDFVSYFKTLEQKLDIVKNKHLETRKNVIDSMLKEYSNIQETNNDNDEKISETVSELTNNLTINNTQSQIIDKHREDDIETNSDEINTHSNSQELANISDSVLVATEEVQYCYEESVSMQNEIYLEDGDFAKNSNEINTSDPELNDILELSLAIEDVKNNVVFEAVNNSTVNNQSQPIESYQENNIENLQIIRQMHTEEVMPSVEKRKLCYDKHEDLYTHKRQCNNHEVNNGNITELALNEQENSINVDCPTSVSISHLAGESTYILSDTAGYSAYILE